MKPINKFRLTSKAKGAPLDPRVESPAKKDTDHSASANCKAYYHSFFENNRLNFALSVFLFLCLAAESVAVSWILGEVMDIIAALDFSALYQMIFIIAVILPAFFLLNLAGQYFKARFIHKGLSQYKSFAFSRLSEKSISAFTTENTGRYLSVLTNDIASIEENYLANSIFIPYYCLTFFLALFTMLYYSRVLTLSVVAFTLLPILVTVLLGKELTVRERRVSDLNESFTARIKDLLGGFSVIKSFKAETQANSLFQTDNGLLEKAKEQKRWYSGLLNALSNLACSAMQFGIFLIGAWLAIRGDISIGTVILFVNLCNFIISPIQIIPGYLASRKAAKGLIEKLAALTQENTGRTGDQISPILTDCIRLSDVTFGYEEGKPVLQNLSCQFDAGKSYAIVGASGSGKTTLFQLLMGAFSHYSGSLTVDGKDLLEISTDSLYNLISQVGQNVFLFDDTIRQNITMFRSFSDEQIQDAIEKAGLAPVIASRGEDYRCGENGINLSGGERQRISIARSLLRGSSVLLVDEATSALDAMTASHVSGSILDLEGLTRIVITHRMDASLLSRYDKILVLKNGRICEQGTFAELMDRREQFYALYTVANQ